MEAEKWQGKQQLLCRWAQKVGYRLPAVSNRLRRRWWIELIICQTFTKTDPSFSAFSSTKASLQLDTNLISGVMAMAVRCKCLLNVQKIRTIYVAVSNTSGSRALSRPGIKLTEEGTTIGMEVGKWPQGTASRPLQHDGLNLPMTCICIVCFSLHRSNFLENELTHKNIAVSKTQWRIPGFAGFG